MVQKLVQNFYPAVPWRHDISQDSTFPVGEYSEQSMVTEFTVHSGNQKFNTHELRHAHLLYVLDVTN